MTCCNRPSIANFDHTKNYFGEYPDVKIVNRVCVRCYRHWYGPEGEVKEFSRAEWDKLINESGLK